MHAWFSMAEKPLFEYYFFTSCGNLRLNPFPSFSRKCEKS
ncbi:unnamed protein product [Brassica rapa subsp. trilocularis]